MLKQKAINYFDAFKMTDIERLKKLLSEDVKLRDWNVNVSGKESVIREISNIFNVLSCIDVLVVDMYEDGATVVAELIITAKQTGSIKVVDIITFNKCNVICSIRAYRG